MAFLMLAHIHLHKPMYIPEMATQYPIHLLLLSEAAVACKLAWLEEVAYKLASEAWEELACCKLASPGSSA